MIPTIKSTLFVSIFCIRIKITKLDVVFKMLFLAMSNADIDFNGVSTPQEIYF